MKTRIGGILLIAAIATATTFTSCKKDTYGTGPVVSQTLSLQTITGINNCIDADVYLSQGAVQEVRVEGQANIIDHIRHGVHNGTWDIEFDQNIHSHRKITVYITIANLSAITISGSGDIYCGTFDSVDEVHFNIKGSGNIEAGIHANSVYTEIEGSGNVSLSGTTAYEEVKVNGSGDVGAFALGAVDTKVYIYGSGKVEINTSQSLYVKINGSGDVYYKGNPSIQMDNNGSGTVHNSN
jgi:hypothetical protein